MKKLALVLSVLFLAVFTLWQTDKKKKKKKIRDEEEGKIDRGMTGPNGERIYIGKGGGRYFTKDDKKIYVGYKRKKSQHS